MTEEYQDKSQLHKDIIHKVDRDYHCSIIRALANPNLGSKMNIIRIVLNSASSFILSSLALTHYHGPNWVWLTVFEGANLLHAGFTGFCPLAKMLKVIGKQSGSAFN